MEWKTIWSYLPLDFGINIGVIKNTIQKTIFWNNVDGQKIRVKFTNLYGKKALKMKAVSVNIYKEGEITDRRDVFLTLNRQKEIVLEPGEECYSDEVDFEIRNSENLILSIYFEDEVEVHQACCTWSNASWHTVYEQDKTILKSCDEDRDEFYSYEVFPFIEKYMNKADLLVGISEIRLYTERDVRILSLFGDSITHMSYYSDALMKRLYKEFPGKLVVLNKGIGGNKLLSDASYLAAIPGHGKSSGRAGIHRFTKDVFETECPDFVYILIGVNDLMHPYLLKQEDLIPSEEALITAYTEMILYARQKGSQVYLCTIMPLKGETIPFGPKGEEVRKKVNLWIRNQDLSDGVIDFDRATARDKEYMKEELHIGDGLHPNEKGGKVMAEEAVNTGGIYYGVVTS